MNISISVNISISWMIRLTLIKKLIINTDIESNSYPFNLPVIAKLSTLDLNHDVVIFVGNNGCGKSTILEILAVKLKLSRISEDLAYQDSEFKEIKEAISNFKIEYLKKPNGFFFRSEDFITYIRFLEKAKNEAYQEIARIEKEYQSKSPYAKSLASMPHYRTISDIDNLYQKSFIEESHGESYLDFFKSRLKPNYLYILDEAEMPLSIENQLTLLILINEAV